MSTAIILLILVVIVILAIRPSIKHLKGQGGCCGGDDTPKPKKKRLKSPIVSTKTITIEGMHCQNCKKRIENSLNSLDGVICKVDLNKKIAIINMSTPISDDILKDTIEKLDFKILDIK